MNTKSIKLPMVDGDILVRTDEIVYVTSKDKSVTIHLENNEKLHVVKGIGKIENLLDKTLFFRCHRKHIINLQKIRKIKKGYTTVMLNCGETILVSRYRKKKFIQVLNKFCEISK
jgi:two-component system LytT family response regulator